ncbi:hypothetical protein Tco_0629566 [Tanacetum coccineum]|uniref:Uncharacterized protein n=1 Tax=Tanacetum coccineum TaxID=301880 RepID=A0ABQ4WTH1_9ASTR
MLVVLCDLRMLLSIALSPASLTSNLGEDPWFSSSILSWIWLRFRISRSCGQLIDISVGYVFQLYMGYNNNISNLIGASVLLVLGPTYSYFASSCNLADNLPSDFLRLTISSFDYLSFKVLVPIVVVGRRSLTAPACLLWPLAYSYFASSCNLADNLPSDLLRLTISSFDYLSFKVRVPIVVVGRRSLTVPACLLRPLGIYFI